MLLDSTERGISPLEAWISPPQPLTPGEMRQGAVRQIEAALSDAGMPSRLTAVRGRPASFTTPAGQTIHVRTRSFDARRPKWPFFTMEPQRLADGDWFVFVWNTIDEGLVAPTSELRDMAPRIYMSGDVHKPSFVWGASEGVGLYVSGDLVRVDDWLNAWPMIAAREQPRNRQ